MGLVCLGLFVRVCVRDSHPGETRRQQRLKKTRVAISRSAEDAVSASLKAEAGAREEGPRGQNFSVCQPGTGGGGLLPC